MGIDHGIIRGNKSFYKNIINYVRTINKVSNSIKTSIGLRLGFVLSPLLFCTVTDEAIRRARQRVSVYKVRNWRQNSMKISELCDADDMAIIVSTYIAIIASNA